MTAMARRRPITSHPAFAPLIALWLAALLGLTIAVLPGPVLEGWLAAAGMDGLAPLTPATRAVLSVMAGVVGGLAGYALTRRLVGDQGGDPRPRYAEADVPFEAPVEQFPARRRPLRVREELADEFADASQIGSGAPEAGAAADDTEPRDFVEQAPTSEGFMILTPQPVHPPHPAPDLEALLDQFDSVFAAFRAGERSPGDISGDRPVADTVHEFVAQQTGAPAPASGHAANASPIGGLVPDHQAELRAALDKLARSQRKQ